MYRSFSAVFVVGVLGVLAVALGVNAFTQIEITAAPTIARVRAKFLGPDRAQAISDLYGDIPPQREEDKLDRYWMAYWTGRVKVSDNNEMMLFENTKVVYATQAIVVAANQALHAAGSVVKLYILQGVPSVNALRAADGSEVNPAVALYQIAYLDGHSTELLKKPLRETIQDCNGMVMQVMGELDGNPTVFVDGKYRRCASPLAAAQNLIDEAMKNTPTEAIAAARARWDHDRGYAPDTPQDGDAGTVPADAAIDWAAAKGIAWFARPMVAEGFYIHRVSEFGGKDGWYPHHGGGVILTAPAAPALGTYDALTLEQVVDHDTATKRSANWCPHMFYVPSANNKPEFKLKFAQTFQSIEQIYFRANPYGAITVRQIHGTGGDPQVNEFVGAGHRLLKKCKFNALRQGIIDLAALVATFPSLNIPIYNPPLPRPPNPPPPPVLVVPTLAVAYGQIQVDPTDLKAEPYIPITCGAFNFAQLQVPGQYAGVAPNLPSRAGVQTHRLTLTKLTTENYLYPTDCFNAYRYSDQLADQEKLKVGDWVHARVWCDISGRMASIPFTARDWGEGATDVPLINYGFPSSNGERACQIVKAPAPVPLVPVQPNYPPPQRVPVQPSTPPPRFLQHNQRAKKLRRRTAGRV